MKGINTFIGGLNQDSSTSKYQPNTYYYLLNGKVITEKGLSTGSVSNEIGNTLLFKIPDTAPVYEIILPENYTGTSQLTITTSSGSVLIPLLTDTLEEVYNEITSNATVTTSITNLDYNVFLNSGRIVIVGLDNLTSVTLVGNLTINNVVPALTDLEICGWGTLEKNIVVFTTDNRDDAPTGEAGQIWELEFDESTNTIKDLSNDFLVPSVHLKYNNKLNLSMANRVGEVIGRYENQKIRGIYFTDFYNSLRGFNLANPEGMALPPSVLDVRSDLRLSEPEIQSVGNGSIPIGSTVQYGYRLKTINGSTSIISHLSPPTPLGEDPTGNYEDVRGAGYNSSNSRSVTYKIDNIDTSFDLIEHIVVLYEQLDVPQVYIFKEEQVPSNGELTVIHVGNEDYIQLTLQELNIFNYPFVCKTITTKRNKLIPANIKYSKSILDFDARAYRFDNTPKCRLYDKQGNYTDYGTITTLTALAEDADAINPYNDESGTVYNTVSGTVSTWDTDYQYKYQADGITLGGEGPNVSYTFVTIDTTAVNSDALSSTPPHVAVGTNSSPIYTGLGTTVSNNNYRTDFRSPLVSTYLRGYKRGEIYRFGIVFFDKKGNPMYTKWIGDIRFPEVSEFDDLGSATSSGASLATKQLGIEFTVDISSIQTEISGYSIVRMERKEKDKTRINTCCPIGLPNNTSGNGTALEGLFQQSLTEDVKLNGSSTETGTVMYLQDYPGVPETGSLIALLNPAHQYNFEYEFKNGDYLKDVSHYITRAYCMYYDSTGDNTVGVYYKGYTPFVTTSYRFKIEDAVSLNYKETVLADDLSPGNVNTIINASYSKDGGFLASNRFTPLGLGNRKQVLLIDSTPPAGFEGDIRTGWNNGVFVGGTYGALSVGNTFGSGDFEIKLVDYCRFPSSQYGGASYESRASNNYISTGHFKFIDNSSSTINTSEIFGGDCFTTYYTDEYITMHWETAANSSPYLEQLTNLKLSCAVGFPCETDINFNLRHGRSWADEQDYSGTWTSTPYSYNSVYSQEPIAIKQYVSPALLDTSTDEHPHAVLVSEEKLDGEVFDSWKVYASNNYLEVDGVHGDINKIITFKDRVVFYQTRAIGQVSVQDRSITQDATGTEVILGTGQVLDYYGYITTDYGCFHQFSVVKTPNALYNFDTLGKKVIQLTANESPISDVKGLSAFFAEVLEGDIRELDQTLWYNTSTTVNYPAVGIHGVYDKRNSRVIWTILKGEVGTTDDGVFARLPIWNKDNITISFNELLNSFESFESYHPKLYLQADARLLSVDPANMGDSYLHGVGDRGNFYGNSDDTKITLVINSSPNDVKILDVIEYLMDLKDSSGADIPLETFNTLRIYNSYQDTGTLTLTPQNNIKRRLRKWRINVLRDNSSNKPRLRDYHFFLELTYNNNNNKEMVLHDVAHYIRPSNF